MVKGAPCSPAVLRGAVVYSLVVGIYYGGHRHSVYYPASVLVWYVVFVLAVRWLQRDERCNELVLGYPRWSYLVSLGCGGGLLTLMLVSFCSGDGTGAPGGWAVDRGGSDSGAGGTTLGGGAVDAFLHAPSPGAAAPLARALHMQPAALLFAALLKDYAVYERGLESVFLLHHLVSITGVILCLHLPRGAGIGVLNMVVAELGSQVYNNMVLRRGLGASRLLYYVGMSASNLLVVWTTYRMCLLQPLGLGYKVSYVAMCAFLVLVRFVGKFLVDEQFAAEATEAGTGGKKSQ